MLIFLILLMLTINLAQFSIVDKSNLKELLTDSEWNTLVGSVKHDNLDILWHSNQNNIINNVLHLESQTVFGKQIEMKLNPASYIFDKHFVILRRNGNISELLPRNLSESHCYYTSFGVYRAILNLCDGMRGVIKSQDNNYFIIHPLPKRFHKRSIDQLPHIIIKRNFNDNQFKYWPDNLTNVSSKIRYYQVENIAENHSIIKRSTEFLSNAPAYIETAVFIDRDLYEHMSQNFPSDTEKELVRFVLTMVNAVQLLYHDPSLGRQVNFVMKRLEILHTDPTGLVRSRDIDRFLGNFCAWQREQNPPNDSDPLHWDHALILTGLDLYVLSKNGKISRQVVGLAPVAGMCTATSSCTVNEGRHFESVYVVAHEIGHNLGMRHDGPLADNNCDPGSYLMSPTLGSGKITWSSCSRKYLNHFMRSSQARCLMDYSISGIQLDHGSEGTLPGERFDANQQCMLKYGKKSVHSLNQSINDICRDLHCTQDRYTWTSHPALEGTPCGVEKWCRSGRCISKSSSALHETIDGSWSSWSSYSDCASGCLFGEKNSLTSGSIGITVASRTCNNPRPEYGGESCIGYSKKFKTCLPQQCESLPRITIQSFSDEICSRAREVDAELTGVGYQKTSSEHEACTVWCQRRSKGAKSKGWIFPDGTTCKTNKRKPTYCIAGICQEFRCTNNDEEEFSMPTEMCSSLVLFSRDKRREVAVGIWLPVTDCYYNCINPGRGLRLVEKRPCRHCNITTSIQLCQPNHTTCDVLKTTSDEATIKCSNYKEKVKRLSGVGVQLSGSSGLESVKTAILYFKFDFKVIKICKLNNLEDPDRPCRLACQDERIPQRFYLVNGEDGWFPFGTDCSRGDLTKKSYCVSGRCVEFGSDDGPLHESIYSLPRINFRQQRSIRVLDILQQNIHLDNQLSGISINFSHPIDVTN